MVCTGRKSCIHAIKNINSDSTVAIIRSRLTEKQRKVKIMWAPGYANISGIFLADAVTKYATKTLVLTQNTINRQDIKNLVNRHIIERASSK